MRARALHKIHRTNTTTIRTTLAKGTVPSGVFFLPTTSTALGSCYSKSATGAHWQRSLQMLGRSMMELSPAMTNSPNTFARSSSRDFVLSQDQSMRVLSRNA